MARIALYIPDDRMPDIEECRAAMNFSQLFIDAFDRARSAESRLSRLKESEMKSVVLRLKKESNKTFERGWKDGVALGNVWAAKHSHISHLRRIGEGVLSFDKPDDDVVEWLDWLYRGQGYQKTPEDESNELALEQHHDAETYRRGRNAGFLDASKNIWEQIRLEFTDDSEQATAAD